MADIRITPAASQMSFTSSAGMVQTITQQPSGSLIIAGSGSTGRTELFAVNGNNGRLFTVSDDLSDSLFSVNTIAGIPVIEAFSDYDVFIGKYGGYSFIASGSGNAHIGSGSGMFVSASGNVGIGTLVPESRLHIYSGSFGISPALGGNYDDGIRIHTSSVGYSAIMLGATSGATGTGIGQWSILRWPTSPYNNLFSIRHNISDYFSISASGYVGIGTTTPRSMLHVRGLAFSGSPPPAGTIDSGSSVYISNVDPLYGMILGSLSSGTGYIQQQRTDGGASAYPLLLNPNGGGIGIGTNNPQVSTVHIVGRSPAESPSVNYILSLSDTDDVTKGLRLGYTSSLDAGVIAASDSATSWRPVLVSPYDRVGLGTITTSSFVVTTGGSLGPSSDAVYDLGAVATRWRALYVSTITASNINGNIVFSGKTDNYVPYWSGNTLTGTSTIWDTGARVGIGTNAIPSGKLRVIQSSGGTGISGTDGSGSIRIGWNTGFGIGIDAWDGGLPRWGILKYSSETPTVIMEGTYQNGNVLFMAGNIGIGTTNPAAKLHVLSGSVAMTNAYALYTTDNAANYVPILSVTTGNNLQLSSPSIGGNIQYILNSGAGAHVFYTGSGEAMRIAGTNGYVGIGTNNPQYTLHVYKNYGAADTSITVQNANALGAYLQTMANSNYSAVIHAGTSQAWASGEYGSANWNVYDITNTKRPIIVTANTPDNTIVTTTAGNVGIGTATAGFPLQINSATGYGSASVTATPNGLLCLSNLPGTGLTMNMGIDASNGFVYGWVQPRHASVATFYDLALCPNGGDVGIGTYTPTSYINATPAYTWLSSSGEFLSIYSATNESNINLITSASADRTGIGGIYWTRVRGQGDAHWQVAGIKAIQNGSSDTLAGADLYFYTKTNGSGRTVDNPCMVINAVGNVGIGITAPSLFTLQVAGNVGPNANATYDLGSAAVAWRNIYVGGITSSNIQFSGKTDNYHPKWLGNTLTPTSSIYDNGNVGIGTNSPLSKLDITAGGDFIGDSYSQMAFSWRNGGYRHWLQTTHNSAITGNGIFFYVNSSSAAGLSSGPSTGSRLALALLDGKVGIGTNNPMFALQVGTPDTNLNQIVGHFAKSANGLNLYGSSILRVSNNFNDFSTGSNAYYSDLEFNSGGSGPHRYGTYGDTNLVNGTTATNGVYGNINLVTSGSVRMTVAGGTSAGFVGVNTSVPLDLFHIKTGMQGSASLYLAESNFNNSNGQTIYAALSMISGSADLGIPQLKLARWGGATTTTIGSIGLGLTTNPGRYDLQFSAGTRNVGAGFINENLASEVRMTIRSDTGNVGIGITNPTFNLDVSASARAGGVAEIGQSTAYTNYAYFGHSSITPSGAGNYAVLQSSTGDTFVNAASGRIVYFRINNADIMTLLSTGFVGVGTTNPTQFKFQVAGNVGPDSNATYDLGSTAVAWRTVYVSGSVKLRGPGNTTATGSVEFADNSAIPKWRIQWDSTSNSLDFNFVG